MTVMDNSKHTGVLQFFCTLLDFVLRAAICHNNQHLRDVPPHTAVRREHLFIDVLQSNAWMRSDRGHTLINAHNASFSDAFIRSLLENTEVRVKQCCSGVTKL